MSEETSKSALSGTPKVSQTTCTRTAQWQSGILKQDADAGSNPVGCAATSFLTHYVIVRRDLPLGSLAAQIVHAAGESSLGPDLPPDTRAVVLAAKNELHLVKIEYELIQHGIPHRAIREPDQNDELMAIGIVPVADRSIVKPVTKKLRRLE